MWIARSEPLKGIPRELAIMFVRCWKNEACVVSSSFKYVFEVQLFTQKALNAFSFLIKAFNY
jgi:hypothetical protein